VYFFYFTIYSFGYISDNIFTKASGHPDFEASASTMHASVAKAKAQVNIQIT
jgi:hypothetical protein